MPDNALELHALSKTYKNGVQALKEVSLSVKKGEFFALLGANGAGKSTTIGLITTLIKKTSGRIFIEGYDLETSPAKAKACLGLVPQEINLNIFESPKQILINQAGYYGIPRDIAEPRAHDLLNQLGLLSKQYDIVRHLSGGMKRRLMIARALVHQPSVLILDEPTAGVDVEIRRSMWDFLTETNQQGTTIILTTHYLEEAEQLCEKVAIIHEGKIVRNENMKTLLQTLGHQTFVLTTKNPIYEPPDFSPFNLALIDSNTLELRLDNNIPMNDVFSKLSKEHIEIVSLRNKTNRLEELFMDLIRS